MPDDDVKQCELLTAAATPAFFQLDQIRRRMNADLRHVLPIAETEQWIQITDQHVAAYGALPPSMLLGQLTPDLSELAELIGQYPQQSELALLASRLCGLTGALHTDLGDNRAARGWLHTADRYAGMRGDAAARHWVAMAQAMATTYPPNPERAIAIAAKATAEFGPHTSASAAQLAGLAARAHAMLGDYCAARTQLAAAEQIAARLSPAQADEPFFGFPIRQMAMYISQVLTAIGDPAAWDAQTAALADYPVSDRIDRPLLLLCRARHLVRLGEPEHAADIATAEVTALSPRWLFPLLISEARAVGRAITAVSPQVGHRYRRVLSEAVSAGREAALA